MNKQLQAKLAKLPTTPGVYFHKSKTGEIIYVGKAANLRNRVRQYFQKSRFQDAKTDALVAEINDVDWTELESEADALFLEAELIRRYHPRFNIMLRDDKSLQFVRIDFNSDYPTVGLVRRPLDDGAQYYGPYLNGFAVKKALRYLRRAFPYAVKKPVGQKRASLHYHLGLDPGLEEGRTSLSDYRANLRKLIQYLKGNRVALVKQIEKDMKHAARAKDFELAAVYRNQLFSLQALGRQILFGDRELQDASRDEALAQLSELLGFKKPPRRIEGFDISHMQGTDTVASMVVFINGVPDKASYRKFKMRLPGNDDFVHMHETLSRRFSANNRNRWGVPDLVLIDGGKGQLTAALKAVLEINLSNTPTIGLAKRDEEIIIHRTGSLPGTDIIKVTVNAKKSQAYVSESVDFISVLLPKDSPAVKLLQRIRDESHRFAVSYHTSLKRTRQTASILDQIPGVGPATRKKIVKHFGSVRSAIESSQGELIQVLGPSMGQKISKYFNDIKTP